MFSLLIYSKHGHNEPEEHVDNDRSNSIPNATYVRVFRLYAHIHTYDDKKHKGIRI